MGPLNRLAVFALVTGSLLASGCDPVKRSNQKDAPPKAINPYRGGEEPPKLRSTSKELSAFDDADGVNIETKNQCAIDICGPVFEPRNEQSAPKNSEELRAQMLDLTGRIEKSIARDYLVDKFALERLDQLKPQIKDVKLEEAHRAVINMYWMLSNLGKAYGTWSEGHFDDESLKKALPEMSASDIENFKEMATYFLKSPDFLASRELDILGADSFFAKLAKSEEAEAKRSAAKAWAQPIAKKLATLHQKFPLLFSKSYPAIEALAAGKDIDDTMVLKLGDEVGEAFLHSVMVNNMGTFVKRDFSLAAIADEYFQKSREEGVYKTSAGYLQSKFNVTLAYCGKTLSNLNGLKSKEDSILAGAPAIIEQVRSKVSESVADFTEDTQVRDFVRAKVKATRFLLPDKAQVRVQKIDQKIAEEMVAADESLELLKKGSLSELALMMASATLNGSDLGNQVAELCGSLDPARSTDNSRSGYGLIQLSWRTLAQSKTGYGVIAHEFGHEVSAQLTAQKQTSAESLYAKVKSCLVDRKALEEERVTSEEDFADLFAQKTIARLKADQIDAGNFACVLMSRDDSRWGIDSGLSLKWPQKINDSHSPSFYRAVQHEIDAGRALSQSCKSVVEQGMPTMTRTCL
jgi:hypothetical protein